MLNCGAAAPVTVSVSFSRVPHLPQPQISSASLSSHHPSNPGGGGDPEEAKLTLPRYKWRLLIAYDGTQYSGWQYQQSPPTIQCIVESALTRATKLGRKDLSLVGASRTDAGVHAWGQVAHFVTPFNYDSLNSIHAALNGLLPSDIRVREISPAIPEFHARYSAKSKVYCYKVYNDTIMDPFQRHHAYHNLYKLNTIVMREAAKHFVGKHDFSAFVNTTRNDRLRDPVKNIFHFEVIELGALLQLEVEGSGFLYRQVRNMVNNLLSFPQELLRLLCCFKLEGKQSLLTSSPRSLQLETGKNLLNMLCLFHLKDSVLQLSSIEKSTYSFPQVALQPVLDYWNKQKVLASGILKCCWGLKKHF
ncbi:uncharacterized protein LOC131151659 isoform X1 [Malania oleifera]|uniref:uncharacterized protein LOC131151659 isoform X1 n=1 Tax=Malania oleifera TaxID=397392 RepID=UPI0025AE0ACA|nr:uncharacterized protein LOC131151659 isoform X1 [Malania oleifera]